MELLLPKHCAGCGEPGQSLCSACRRQLANTPQRLFTPVDPHVPVWVLSPYAGVHRELILAMKERGRRDVPPLLGSVVNAALLYLAARGEIPELSELRLVPAPTKRTSARKRGGDPVTAVCRGTDAAVSCCVRHSAQVRDSVGLDSAARRKNLAGNVVLTTIPTGPVVIVDDVVTTGATIAATAAVLFAANVQVAGVLAICGA
ncbi:ComF family protein [Corynebacterium sp. H128]|uniref:ComF family protein n=1 Tax=unclassified Corynebacterium TaxID=2624378 RepID=UPI0030B18C16